MVLKARVLSRWLLIGAACFTFTLSVYTFYNFSVSTSIFRWFVPRFRSTCIPEAYDNGSWVWRPRHPIPINQDGAAVEPFSPDDLFKYNGFEGCAADREYAWHLGVDHSDRLDRFPSVVSWAWQPSSECNSMRPLKGADIVKDLVEKGGWLMLGDSITENHFFSLSCLLYPHVRATPNYTENPYFDRAWAQNLYLSPSSPLIHTLRFPPGFSIEDTPLATFRRVDLLMSQSELQDIYRAKILNPSIPGFENAPLFSDELTWTLSPSEYMNIFTAPLPEGGYSTLVTSTGGHWTTTLMSAFRDEEQGDALGYGIEGVLRFFQEAMKIWATNVQYALDVAASQDRQEHQRQVIVRAYLPGHEDCHYHKLPWDHYKGMEWRWYNWWWIKDFNQKFKEILSSPGYPDIHFLSIDGPGLLRPDAHAASDCLHLVAGAGVMEGWTHYIWHYITREIHGQTR